MVQYVASVPSIREFVVHVSLLFPWFTSWFTCGTPVAAVLVSAGRRLGELGHGAQDVAP